MIRLAATFAHHYPTRLLFGAGRLAELGAESKSRGSRALLITGQRSLKDAGVVDRALASLRRAGVEVVQHAGVSTNPVVKEIDEIGAIARRERCDVFIGLGGGSCIDAAKMAALLVAQGGSCWDYINTPERPARRIQPDVPPIIAVPSTSGAGSEGTPFAVVTEPAIPMKKGMGNPALYPAVAIVDADILRLMPKTITASTGADALGQALEGWVSGKATPATTSIAREAFRSMVTHLPRAYRNGDDTEARLGAAWGAAMAGVAIGHIDVNLAHAMSHPLSARYNVHHGTAVGLLTPVAMEFNLDAAPAEYAEVCRILEPNTQSSDARALSARAPDAMREFLRTLGIPLRLRDVDVPQADLRMLAAESLEIGAIRTNIKPVSLDAAIQLFERAW